MRARLHLAAAMVVASVITFGTAMPAVAAQTFPDPFGGEGLFVDISSGAQGLDVGDAFFLRDGEVLRIRMFLDAPNSFIETHVCFSADPFTARIPPGQCPYEQSGAGSGSYDIQLPPSSFPAGTVPFTDPLGEFCVQVHVAYSAPGLALTSAGGGSAFAGWQPGSPFFGSVCFPPAPEPPPPFEATVEVTKTGAVDGLQLTFTVTVLNPTASVAENVVLVDSLPAGVAWTLPAQCALGVDEEAICNLGNIDDGISVELEFTATLPEGECGTFSNGAYAFVDGRVDPDSSDAAAVEVECPPDPPADPLILLTKEASATEIVAPGTLVYTVTFENTGPGAATDVVGVDVLPDGPTWTIGSGSNICTLDGTTVACSAEQVADGVFEVFEFIGTIGPDDCGTFDNTAEVTFAGGPRPGSVSAVGPTVTVTGCPTATATPAPTPRPTPTPCAPAAPSPTSSPGEGGEPGEEGPTDPCSGGLPDTRLPPSATWLPAILVIAALVLTAVLRFRPRSAAQA